MADFSLNSILGLLSDGGVSAIGKRTKVKQEDVGKVLAAGVPTLISGMKKNTRTGEGTRSLSLALSDHSTADVSDVGGFLKTADLKDGKKILGHVLGDREDEVVNRISASSGVSKGKVTSILAIVAPLLLSLLGNQQNQGGSGFDLGGLLGNLLGGAQGNQGGANLLGSLGGLLGGASQQSSQPAQQDSGLLSLFGSGSNTQSSAAQSEQQSGSGLLDGLLSLFH